MAETELAPTSTEDEAPKKTKKKPTEGKKVKVEDTKVYKQLVKEHDKTKLLLKEFKKKCKSLSEEVTKMGSELLEVVEVNHKVAAEGKQLLSDNALLLVSVQRYRKIIDKIIE